MSSYIRRTLASEWVTNPHVDPEQADPLVEVRLSQTKAEGNRYEISTDFGTIRSRNLMTAQEKFELAVRFWQSKKAVPQLLQRGPDGVRF